MALLSVHVQDRAWPFHQFMLRTVLYFIAEDLSTVDKLTRPFIPYYKHQKKNAASLTISEFMFRTELGLSVSYYKHLNINAASLTRSFSAEHYGLKESDRDAFDPRHASCKCSCWRNC